MENLREYLLWVLVVFSLIAILLGTATIIISIPELRTGFNAFFNAEAMTWEKAKPIMIKNYIMALPLSFLFGLILFFVFKEDSKEQ